MADITGWVYAYAWTSHAFRERSQKVTHQDLITTIYNGLEKYSHDLF